MPSIQQSSALLALPAELQNQIYDYVAHSTDKTVMITAPDKTVSLPAPFGQVCNQLREEFTSVFYSLSLAYATNIVLYNTKFDLLSLILGLRDILGSATDVKRTLTFHIILTNALRRSDIETFIKELSEPAVSPKTAATIKCRIPLRCRGNRSPGLAATVRAAGEAVSFPSL